jgi:hypothetical protein
VDQNPKIFPFSPRTCASREGQFSGVVDTRLHRNRKGERGNFSGDDYIAFLDQAHQRLRAPIVLIWDNLNTHVSVRMRELTVVRLPDYAPDLNPAEGVWR